MDSGFLHHMGLKADPVFWSTTLLYTLAFYNCFRIIGQNISPQTALAWILINAAFPPVGVPLYYLLGQNRLKSYVKRRRKSRKRRMETDQISERFEVDQMPVVPYISEFEGFARLSESFTPSLATDVQLLIDGEMTFESIFQEIKSAKRYIFVQYYILRSDRLGLELKQLLIEKAKEGVAIFLLLDHIGSFFLTQSYLKDLSDSGVHIAKFLPLRLNLQINFRNHRKLVVVDGRSAFLGGLNVGVEYLGKQKAAYWRDTHVKVTGAVVERLEEVFLDDWYFAARKRTKRLPALVLQRKVLGGSPSTSPTPVQVVSFGPNDETQIGLLLFLQIINIAKERLWIASPYFVPDSTLEQHLELAAVRGVDVRILIPSTSDHHFVHWVTMGYAKKLVQKGIKVFCYQKGFMHQKIILVDNELTVLGTSNFDNRSIYLNFETALLVYGKNFGDKITAMLVKDFASSRELTMEATKTSWLVNFRSGLVSLLAPLM
ncbi:MAG: cardiolipin synthase [Oligoflexales bacterium]